MYIARHCCNTKLSGFGEFYIDSGFQSNDSTYPANTFPPLFPPHSVVVEITDGSMDALSDVVSSSSVSMVMLYAPWCYFSKKTATYFEQAAVTLKDEVQHIHLIITTVYFHCFRFLLLLLTVGQRLANVIIYIKTSYTPPYWDILHMEKLQLTTRNHYPILT